MSMNINRLSPEKREINRIFLEREKAREQESRYEKAGEAGEAGESKYYRSTGDVILIMLAGGLILLVIFIILAIL